MSIESVLQQLSETGLDPDEVVALVEATLAEDLAGGVDVTTVSTVSADQQSTLDLTSRADGVVAGVPVAALVFEIVAATNDEFIDVTQLSADGDNASPGVVVLQALGSTRTLLTAERTALNLLCHLSGIATATEKWAQALAGSNTRVRDTRKTMPLLRSLQKYAVRCGGGVNHRMSLSDAALVKDNHVVAAGGVAEAFAAVRAQFPDLAVEVEVDSLAQLHDVIDAGADLVLLDNFTFAQMKEAVEFTAGRAILEASGGLVLEDAPEIASTGVDFVAVGELTHSARVLDIGADLTTL